MPNTIIYLSGGKELLADIKPLWQKLNKHHAQVSPHFTEDFQKFTFEQRTANLKKKYKYGQVQINIAKDRDLVVGYVITVITEQKIGEI